MSFQPYTPQQPSIQYGADPDLVVEVHTDENPSSLFPTACVL